MGAKQLKDYMPMGDYSIARDATIYMTFRLHGGSPTCSGTASEARDKTAAASRRARRRQARHTLQGLRGVSGSEWLEQERSESSGVEEELLYDAVYDLDLTLGDGAMPRRKERRRMRVRMDRQLQLRAEQGVNWELPCRPGVEMTMLGSVNKRRTEALRGVSNLMETVKSLWPDVNGLEGWLAHRGKGPCGFAVIRFTPKGGASPPPQNAVHAYRGYQHGGQVPLAAREYQLARLHSQILGRGSRFLPHQPRNIVDVQRGGTNTDRSDHD